MRDALKTIPVIITLLVMMLVLAACHVRTESKVYGRYSASHNGIEEFLILNTDHRFAQIYKLPNGVVDSALGDWSYDSVDGYLILDSNYFDLSDAKLETDFESLRKNQLPGFVITPVSHFFCRIEIGTREGGIFYTKLDVPK